MRFLVDAQLPPVLARRLRGLGHEAEHVYDIGMQAATDRAIWKKRQRQALSSSPRTKISSNWDEMLLDRKSFGCGWEI